MKCNAIHDEVLQGHLQGAERNVRVPKELLRFQDLPMQVCKPSCCIEGASTSRCAGVHVLKKRE